VTRFLLRRVLLGALVLWIVTTLVFVLFFVTPNDVARRIAGKQATPDTVALVRERLGLDRPVLEQYWSYLDGLAHGNLGYSFYNSEPVTHLLGARVGVTASLAVGGLLLCVLIGVAGGLLAASRPRSATDRAVNGIAMLFYSLPQFLLGVLLLYVLFYVLALHGFSIFPPSGYTSLRASPYEWARHLVLPWCALALTSAASYARLTRASLLEELGEDYIRAARARGIGERTLLVRHALRAALTPSLSQIGVDLGALLGGVIILESVFGLPGLGQLALQSLQQQDLPVIIGTVILASTFVLVANIVVDVGYVLLDHRVPLN
jgi:peptide/nickel transport system permease protein